MWTSTASKANRSPRTAVFRKEKKESYLFPLGKYLRIFNWGLGLERWAKVRIAD